jgi:hypothetical protein
MSHTSPLAVGLGVFLLLAVTLPSAAAAQQPSDSLRAAAMTDYHGPDLSGKDGPFAKAGLDLLLLYHEYRAFRERGGDTFSPSVGGVQVSDGYVTIEAIAATTARALRTDLKALGVTDAATAGRLVSGRLPIDQIPALAKLETLRGVVVSRAQTHGNTSATEPSRAVPDKETLAESNAGKESSDGGADGGMLLFLLGVVGLLLLTEL